jgi:hypothetical protein
VIYGRNLNQQAGARQEVLVRVCVCFTVNARGIIETVIYFQIWKIETMCQTDALGMK